MPNVFQDKDFDFSSGDIHPFTLELASKIASKSASALAIGKQAMAAHSRFGNSPEDLVKAYETASQFMSTNLLERDAEHGISCFLRKEKPKWEWEG